MNLLCNLWIPVPKEKTHRHIALEELLCKEKNWTAPWSTTTVAQAPGSLGSESVGTIERLLIERLQRSFGGSSVSIEY